MDLDDAYKLAFDLLAQPERYNASGFITVGGHAEGDEKHVDGHVIPVDYIFEGKGDKPKVEPTEKKQKSVTIKGNEANKEVAQKVLKKFGIKESDLAELVGALDGAEISYRGDWIDGKPSLTIDISHPLYHAQRGMDIDRKGNKFIHNASFFLNKSEEGKGIGTGIFSDQVSAAQKNGFAYIQCSASRQEDDKGNSIANGYYTWPRLGYDMEVEDLFGSEQARVKKKFPKAKTIQDIFKTKEGRDWWKENGVTLRYAKFDLTKNSSSLRILGAYRQERAKRGK